MWESEKHKKGKRHYGWFLTNTVTNIKVYLARRNHKDIFKSGEVTTSDALRNGSACWGLDMETLQLCKIRGVSFVGIKVMDRGGMYVTGIANFFDPKYMNLKSNAKHRYLPLECFRVLHQPVI